MVSFSDSPSESVLVQLTEVGRLRPPMAMAPSYEVRLTGGLEAAYVTGLNGPHQWGWVNPIDGGARWFDRRGDRPGEFENVRIVTGAPKNDVHFVIHDGRLSIVDDSGRYLTGRLLSGAALGARATQNGSAQILVQPRNSATDLLLHTVSTTGTFAEPLLIRGHFPSGTVEFARWGALAKNALYVANVRPPYDVLVYDYAGTALRRIAPRYRAPFRGADSRSRNALVLAIHEVDSLVIVVTATRTDSQPVAFGNHTRFEKHNIFGLDVIHARTGRVISSITTPRPAFYGSMSDTLVYRIDEDPVNPNVRTVVFLLVTLQERGASS
jgi:hypothetical protein